MQQKDIILKIENVSKQYRLGLVGTGTISHDLNRWWHKIRGKEDPYLKVGDINNRSVVGESQYVWALKGIDFEVNRGEVLGVIGKNGAGKSTLLKILSKVTGPTTGEIKTKGRIASLLEVGTGFHNEMTGRENIFLNGAILGMTKKEIALKIDEIIEFSGCQRYVETPVKRYSTGMKVRLAFAVAAFLEPEILVVDEVLAVGDAEFQKKAIGKMQDVSNSEGRTVVFVSHNMSAVKSLCTRLIVLEDGKIKFNGDVEKGLDVYSNITKKNAFKIEFDDTIERVGTQEMFFKSIEMYNQYNKYTQNYSIGDDLKIKFKIKNTSNHKKSQIGVQIFTAAEVSVLHFMPKDSNYELIHNKEEEEFEVNINDIRLYPGLYFIDAFLCDEEGVAIYDGIKNVLTFEIIDGGHYTKRNLPRSIGFFFLTPKWKKI